MAAVSVASPSPADLTSPKQNNQRPVSQEAGRFAAPLFGTKHGALPFGFRTTAESEMSQPAKPMPVGKKWHKVAPDAPDLPEVPEADVPDPALAEGGIPGLPVSHDPLLQPLPQPAEREIKPID
jgi:hypothetical protein